jgi:two-component system cell cycle sensor histidine kinase/response regulator CckA
MSPATVDQRHVLVVDGDMDTAIMLRTMLHARPEARTVVESAVTAADALTAIGARRHDVYLVDVEMDRASRGALLRAAVEAGDGAAIVLLAGHHDSRAEHAVFAAGAAGFIWRDDLSAAVLAYALGHARAVRERTHRERQKHLEQRLASVGQLAGGLAHHFNNILTAIIGFATLLGEQQGTASESVEEILSAADRASALTRQLLAFSRRQVMQPERIDVAEMVQALVAALEPALGDRVALEVVCPANLPPIRADRGQIEEAVSMFVLNAREAMAGGGRITIEVEAVTLDQESCARYVSGRPGAYVGVTVSDTGAVMSPEALSRIFEPFFTREEGETLTVFGLAAVHGIVQQTGGFISASSEPGVGTTFRIYLPVEEQPDAMMSAGMAAADHLRAGETILLVDDTDVIRRLADEVLSRAGYRVLHAGGADEALRVATGHADPIDLLLTDVIMPGPTGVELAARLQAIRGNVPVLFMSGYSDATVVRNGLLSREAAFLQKPFTPAALLDKVRQVLSLS